MFRSQPMACYSVMFTQENAWEVLDELGQLNTVELQPRGEGSARPFLAQLREAETLCERLATIERLLAEEGVPGPRATSEEAVAAALLHCVREHVAQRGRALYYAELGELVQERLRQIEESITARDSMRARLAHTSDYLHALDGLREELPRGPRGPALSAHLRLERLAGVARNDQLASFQKALFRLARGNVYARYCAIDGAGKSAFFLAFPADAQGFLLGRVQQLCDALEVRRFSVPEDWAGLEIAHAAALREHAEARKIQSTAEQLLRARLEFFAQPSGLPAAPLLAEMQLAATKAVRIAAEMEKLRLRDNIVSGRMWIPLAEQRFFFSALKTLQRRKEFDGFRCERVDPAEAASAPTLLRAQGFFGAFQAVVDTYGTPRYGEVNPGLFTAVTFPFLFGLMFGDVAHGLGLLLFGVALSLRARLFPPALVRLRYLLALMGFFAAYCGLIYNEFFALPLPLARSCYGASGRRDACVYPVGLDPAWHAAANSVAFVNSFKMKLSIIVGVLHMTLGIALKGVNAVFFRDPALFLLEFLPQLCFFLATFGYMALCIAVKWLRDFSDAPGRAPSIISLFLSLPTAADPPLFADAEAQLSVQRVLVAVAAGCVPVMLLGRPLAARWAGPAPARAREEDATPLIGREAEAHAAATDPAELFVHQGIETVEFLLGSVSNTASYLRLWALSLAHSQLARVFLDMLLRPFMAGGESPARDGLLLALFFLPFAAVTFGVLMVMDVLECFLHALRLHWVEFQNKFYKGDGVPFRPLSFAREPPCR